MNANGISIESRAGSKPQWRLTQGPLSPLIDSALIHHAHNIQQTINNSNDNYERKWNKHRIKGGF